MTPAEQNFKRKNSNKLIDCCNLTVAMQKINGGKCVATVAQYIIPYMERP